jgi:predicted Zn-dependent protease
VERSLFLSAVEAALSLSATAESGRTGAEFARQACTQWLARWPGDFRVRAHLADADIALGALDDALQQLLQVMQAEPEAAEPYRALSALYQSRGDKQRALEAESCLYALGSSALPSAQLPEWADTLQTALRLMGSGRWQEARLAAESVMVSAPDYPLPALVHLKALYSLAEYPAVLSAGKAYRTRWAGCSAFLLLMAQA